MAYRIELKPAAKKAIESLDKQEFHRIRKAIDNLSLDPHPKGCVKLSEIEAWRIRVGSFQILYMISDKDLIVLILKIGNRKDIYRSLR